MMKSLKYVRIIDCSFKYVGGSFVSSFYIIPGVYYSWNKNIKSTTLVSKFAPNTQPTRTLIVHSTTKPKHQTTTWRDENASIFVNPINCVYSQCHVLDLHNHVTFILLHFAYTTLYPCSVGHKRKSLLLATELKTQDRYSLNSFFGKRNKRHSPKHKRQTQKE